MKSQPFISLVGILLVMCPTTRAQKETQPKTIKPAPLSDGFIRPATRAFTTIKESTGVAKGPTPADDRIKEAEAAASTPADRAFVSAINDYKTQKWFSILRMMRAT